METALVKGALEVIECEQQRPRGFCSGSLSLFPVVQGAVCSS